MSRSLRWIATVIVLGGFMGAAWGYALLGSKWNSSRIVMYLQLGSSGGSLIDGASSWNASGEDALAIWNQYLAGVQFTVVRNSSVAPGDGDGVNNVFFDNTLYGRDFGDAVAITTEWTQNGGRDRIEADTVFNSDLNWNSYRGNLRSASGGGTLYDLRRVALHEFGHTLGLDHPDEHGQNVDAIMNSRVSDVDTLLADDIRGAQALYGARVTETRATFTRPTASKTTTAASHFVFRGRADIAQVNAVYLTNSKLGTSRFLRANGVQTWSRDVVLRPGRNVIRLYAMLANGSRVKVAQRVFVRQAP